MSIHEDIAESFPLVKRRKIVRLVDRGSGQVASESDQTGWSVEQAEEWYLDLVRAGTLIDNRLEYPNAADVEEA